MERARRLWIVAILSFAAGVLVTILLQREYASGGFLTDTVNTVTRPPMTATKILFYVAAALIAATFPLALGEGVAERRFKRRERELRAARPADTVTPYAGPEGRGVLVEGPGGRTLLLEALGGFGHPRLVELPPAEAEASPSETPPLP
jgi:hypothetical protein